MTERKTKAIAYYRVSTDKQGVRGLGMAAQEKAVSEWVAFHDLELVAEYREVESGTKTDRPEFHKARRECIREDAVLLIAKLDRLARNVVFVGQLLEDDDLEFVALDMPQASRFEIHIRAALAEEEARLISERTKAGLARTDKPLGCANPITKAASIAARKKKAAEYKEQYRPLVEVILATTDKVNYSAIASQLNKAGKKTARGNPWSRQAVTRLFDYIRED